MIDLAPLLPWLDRESRTVDTVGATLTARLAALLDQPQREWSAGDVVPTSWYVQLFGPTEPQSVLGPDGHPPKGELLPPVPWPRRMFAGRRIEMPGELRIGDHVVRASRVTAIEPKTGRSGPMCFVTVRHEMTTSRGLAVVEEQDVVYRPALAAVTPPPPADPAPTNAASDSSPMPEATFSRTLVPSAPLLFRYSAITNNAHRIHYDLPYARNVEGYPGLVVNGGLSTLLLWELAGQSFEGRLTRSTTRNLRPLFVDRAITLCASPGSQPGSVQAWVQDDTGALAIEAQLEFS